MLIREAVTRVCERQENIFLKAVTPFQMVFFQPKEMFCKDCFMKKFGKQELQLPLWKMNYTNVGSTVMFIAQV